MSGYVPIEQEDYDPGVDIQKLLADPASLGQIHTLLNHVNSYKLSLDNEIQKTEEEYEEYLNGNDKFDILESKEVLSNVIQEINDNKKLSMNTQTVITGMTSSIQRLDNAKKNLVLTMTVLKRLQMLMNAYQQLEILSEEKRYTESVNLLGAVGELIDHFKTYKSIDEIAELTRKVNKLKVKLADQIFRDFEMTLNNKDPISLTQLRSSCDILDLLGQDYHDRLVTWICNQQLKEITTIFSSSDEAGSLENISRRFIYFKKVLKNYEDNFKQLFPDSWRVEEQISAKFCEITRTSIKQVLQQSGKKTDVDLLLNSLQQTLDFEKYLNNHFRYSNEQEDMDASISSDFGTTGTITPKKYDHSIATAFEPFLGIWVENQNTFLSKKFLEFMSQPKLPEGNDSHHADVIPSSADLFRAYRHLLTQCSNLSTGAPLRDLSKLFSKWSLDYSNKLLKPTLPTVVNDEAVEYITLVLNTADYCSSTISQLEDRLIELIDEPYKDKINFDQAKESFIKLINKAINLLIQKIESESEFAWREMANTDWSHMEDVGDQSRYISTLKDILLKNCALILPKFSRDLYIRQFCDKVVESTVNHYLINLVKTRPIPVIAAEQMLLDLSLLKETFSKLPKQSETALNSTTQYQKHVDRMVNKLELILKVLLTQDAPQEGLVTNYFYLIGDKSPDNFIKILRLKGIEDQNRQAKFIELFKIHMKTHENLVDQSPVLTSLNIDSKLAVPSSTNVLTNKLNLPTPDLPKSPIFDNFKKDNFEKSLKEFTTNGEAGVNRINENLQKFGRFFNRNNNNPS